MQDTLHTGPTALREVLISLTSRESKSSCHAIWKVIKAIFHPNFGGRIQNYIKNMVVVLTRHDTRPLQKVGTFYCVKQIIIFVCLFFRGKKIQKSDFSQQPKSRKNIMPDIDPYNQVTTNFWWICYYEEVKIPVLCQLHKLPSAVV